MAETYTFYMDVSPLVRLICLSAIRMIMINGHFFKGNKQRNQHGDLHISATVIVRIYGKRVHKSA